MNAVRSLDLISTKEAASILSCTVQHVRLLLHKGVLGGQKIGRDWWPTRESVHEYDSKRQARPVKKSVVCEPTTASLFPEIELQSIVNVASVPQRSPFRYAGGKTWLVPIARQWLESQGARPAWLIEPFAGGGGISLMAAMERRVEKSLLVELDGDVASVWHCCFSREYGELAELIRKFELTEAAVRIVLDSKPVSTVDRAFQTIIRNRVSRGGILAPGAGLIKNGEANRGLASRWYPETLANRVESIGNDRKKFVTIEGDGLEVMEQNRRRRDVVYFIDPPYLQAGRRLYTHHELDHHKLFETTSRLSGDFLMTYDNHPEIAKLAHEFNFQTRLVPMKSSHHQKKFELLIGRDLEWLQD